MHYLDIVEVHLAYHVSRKSDVFFNTLTSQQELQEQISETRQQVTSLRQTLGSVDELTTHGLLLALKLHKIKSRNFQIFHKVGDCINTYIYACTHAHSLHAHTLHTHTRMHTRTIYVLAGMWLF